MMSRPASKGWFQQFGGKKSRRSRHIKSQMKFWGGPRGRKSLEDNRWSFANKQAKRYGKNGLFGMN